jgi:hypothetical protein
MKKWKAVATFRHTHDKVLSATTTVDDLDEIAGWMDGYDARALEHLIITYNLDDDRLTLSQIATESHGHLQVPAPENADDRPN